MLNTIIFVSLVSLVSSSQKNITCVSNKLFFDKNRIYNLNNEQNISISPDLYDFTLDYGLENTIFNSTDNSIQLKLTKSNVSIQGDGVRLSTVRYFQYGKFTTSMSAASQKGVITAFITMSSVQDEIDVEAIGNDTTSIQCK